MRPLGIIQRFVRTCWSCVLDVRDLLGMSGRYRFLVSVGNIVQDLVQSSV